MSGEPVYRVSFSVDDDKAISMATEVAREMRGTITLQCSYVEHEEGFEIGYVDVPMERSQEVYDRFVAAGLEPLDGADGPRRVN